MCNLTDWVNSNIINKFVCRTCRVNTLIIVVGLMHYLRIIALLITGYVWLVLIRGDRPNTQPHTNASQRSKILPYSR